MPEDKPPQSPPSPPSDSGSDSPPESPPESPPPPSDTPPATPPPSGGKSDNTVMLVLSYLWILALVPLLAEKEDAEVQWHAKNGICFLVAEIVLWIALMVLQFVPVLGNILGCALLPIIWLGILVLHIIAIVKATKGERLVVPGVSDFVERF